MKMIYENYLLQGLGLNEKTHFSPTEGKDYNTQNTEFGSK